MGCNDRVYVTGNICELQEVGFDKGGNVGRAAAGVGVPEAFVAVLAVALVAEPGVWGGAGVAVSEEDVNAGCAVDLGVVVVGAVNAYGGGAVGARERVFFFERG